MRNLMVPFFLRNSLKMKWFERADHFLTQKIKSETCLILKKQNYNYKRYQKNYTKMILRH